MYTGPGSLLVFIVDRAHESSGRRENVVHKDKDSLLGCELDTFSDNQLRFHRICGSKLT